MRGPTSLVARAGLLGGALAVAAAVGLSAAPASAAHRVTTTTAPAAGSTSSTAATPSTVATTPTTVTRPTLPPRRVATTTTSTTATTAPTSGGAANGSSTGSGQPSHPTCSTATLSAARTLVDQQLAMRVTQLNTLVSRTSSAKSLTASDSATLQHDLTQVELPGITGLQQQVPSATTCLELWTDAHDMVFDYRVYLVMTPQTDLTIAADNESAATTSIQALYPTITSAIQGAESSGKNVSAAQQAYSDLQSQVSAASSEVAGVSATVLAQTPAGYPGNASVFESGRSSVDAAAAHLRTAYDDLKTITGGLGLG